jgi:hypothetical protein
VRVKHSTAYNWRGSVRYDTASIALFTHSSAGKPFTPAQRNEALWHEITHAVLHAHRHDPVFGDLHANEHFVTKFAKTLSAAIDSAEF